jgi:hypothetical protein
MPPRYRIGEPGFCLRTRANQVAPDPSSSPPAQAGATLLSLTFHGAGLIAHKRKGRQQMAAL